MNQELLSDNELLKLIAREKWGAELTDEYIAEFRAYVSEISESARLANNMNYSVWRVLYRVWRAYHHGTDIQMNELLPSADDGKHLDEFFMKFDRKVWRQMESEERT